VSRSLEVTVSDEEGEGAAIIIESRGFTEPEMIDALLRVAESIIQRGMRENPVMQEQTEGMTHAQKAGQVAMQSRIALVGMVSDMEFVDSTGIAIQL